MRLFTATLLTVLLASSAAHAAQVVLDPTEVVQGADVIMRVQDDAGQTSAFIGAPTTLDLPNGATYHVTTYDQLREWGSFSLASDGSIGATSGLIAAPSGGATALHFDLTGLTRFTVDPQELFVGNGQCTMKLDVQGSAAVAILIGSAGTIWLPDGAYDVSDYDHVHVYGSFSTANEAVASVGPSLSVDAADPGRVHFVLSAFGAIALPSISQAINGQTIKLSLDAPPGDTVVTLWNGLGTAYLADGAYRLNDYGFNVSYGTFVVQGGQVASATGAYAARSGALAFVPGALPLVRVTLPSNVFTRLGYALASGGFSEIASYFSGTATFTLPPGPYGFMDATGQPGFTVAADGSVSGALPAGYTAVNANPTPAQQLDALIAATTDHGALEALRAARTQLQRGNVKAARSQLYALELATKDKALAASLKSLIQALGG